MAGGRTRAALLVLLLPWRGRTLPPKSPAEGHPWEEATCVIDFLQTTYQLAEAANGINQALIACPPKSSNSTAVADCSSSVGNTLALFLQAAVTICSAMNDCAETTNYGAACAADVLDLTANLAQAVDGTSSFIGGVCKKDDGSPEDGHASSRAADRKDTNILRLPEYSRYLFLRGKVRNYDQFVQDRHAENLEQRVKATQIATCTFSAGEVLFYLTRAAVALHFSVLDCGPNKTVDTEDKLLCTVQIGGVINAFANVVTYAAALTKNCQPTELSQCAAAVGTWLQVVSGLVQDGADFPLSCGGELRPGQVVDLANRRLASRAPSLPTVFV